MSINTYEMAEDRFPNAEHLWFWFISSRKIQNRLGQRDVWPGRCCELLDVETLITKLYLAGRLSAAELRALEKYGTRRRVPNQHAHAENRDAALWSSAMRTIGAECRAKGWVE